jgi:hypothetical protein
MPEAGPGKSDDDLGLAVAMDPWWLWWREQRSKERAESRGEGRRRITSDRLANWAKPRLI